MKALTIKPGFLVSLKTSLTGNVTYQRRDIEAERVTETGEAVATWETQKTVVDAAEHERGLKARSKARSTITRVCTVSTFGYLCPQDRQAELLGAIAEARKIADEFNGPAEMTRLHVAVIVGRISGDDAEAVRAINSEVRSLMDDMEAGIKKLDIKAVREAADAARAMGQMLEPDAAAKVKVAIDAARDLAKRMVKAGAQAAEAIDQATLNSIASARTAFLDLDDQGVIGDVATEQRALDLTPTEQVDRTMAAVVARAVEIEA